MVRFHWHVEDGFAAFIPPCGMVTHKDSKVQTAIVEIELPGQQLNVEALLTVPPGYLHEAESKDVGVILAHGNDADDWRGKLLSEVALELGKAGFVVMRYHCTQKEQRRQRIFEKALDACATSPIARMCTRWVLAGVGSGARVAAAVGTRCRGTLAGFVLMAYPLMEPMPTSKGASLETSLLPLTRLNAPLLFIQPGKDALCNAAMIRDNLDRMPAHDIRMLELPSADGELKSTQADGSAKGPSAHTISRVVAAVLDFVNALNDNSLEKCRVQQLKGGPLASTDTFGGAAEEEKLEAAARAEAAAAAAAAAAATPAPRTQQLQGQPSGTSGISGQSQPHLHHLHQQHQQHAAAHRPMQMPRERQVSNAASALQGQYLNPGALAGLGAAAGLGAGARPGGLPGMAGLLQGLLQGPGGAANLAAALGLQGAGMQAAGLQGAAGMQGAPGNLASAGSLSAALNLATQQQIVAAAMMSAAGGGGVKRPADAALEAERQARSLAAAAAGQMLQQLQGAPSNS